MASLLCPYVCLLFILQENLLAAPIEFPTKLPHNLHYVVGVNRKLL
ncbi:hypothetical protein HMPREF0262_00250 [Clostridium sp. ATCC 29733]|nr:hypothetical protein HMPREF0262_00250 [Clostridium sp. ATCC 29733]